MKWEYKVVKLIQGGVNNLPENHQYWLNFEGANQWELVNTIVLGDHVLAYFKREMKEIGHQRLTEIMKDMENHK